MEGTGEKNSTRFRDKDKWKRNGGVRNQHNIRTPPLQLISCREREEMVLGLGGKSQERGNSLR